MHDLSIRTLLDNIHPQILLGELQQRNLRLAPDECLPAISLLFKGCRVQSHAFDQ